MSKPISKQCLLCQRLLHHELTLAQIFRWGPLNFSTVCQKCNQYLTPFDTDKEVCRGCLSPLLNQPTSQECYCHNCQYWIEKYGKNYLSHTVLFNNSTVIQDWLYRYKYTGDVRLAHVVKDGLQTYAKKHQQANWVILPSSPQNLKMRGFHPTGFLLKTANITFQQPFNYIGDGQRQALKNRQERLKLIQPFQLKSDLKLNTQQPIILFDDVYTTGATMMAAKACIYNHFGSDIVLQSLSLMGTFIKE